MKKQVAFAQYVNLFHFQKLMNASMASTILTLAWRLFSPSKNNQYFCSHDISLLDCTAFSVISSPA